MLNAGADFLIFSGGMSVDPDDFTPSAIRAWGRRIMSAMQALPLSQLHIRKILNQFSILTEEEMIFAVKAAVSIGIEKARITGGDPLVAPDIISICSNIANITGIRELCLTTNGNLLSEKTDAPTCFATIISVMSDRNDDDTNLKKDYHQYQDYERAPFKSVIMSWLLSFSILLTSTILCGGIFASSKPDI